tara:strand:- start:159 stop:407 length:249 start_codon:yes stop_codon:yes gene_type:complete
LSLLALLRTIDRTRATLTLLTHRNISIPTAHYKPLRLRSIQPVMHGVVTTPLHLFLTTLNIRLVSRLSAIRRNLFQQVLSTT